MKTNMILVWCFCAISLCAEDLRLPPKYQSDVLEGSTYLPIELKRWQNDFLARLEFHSTNRFARFELTEYWMHVGRDDAYDVSYILQGAFERALSDSARDFFVDLPISIWFEDQVSGVSHKLARFARRTISGKEERDQFPSFFGGESHIPFDFRGVPYSPGLKVGLRPWSTDPNMFFGYVFDEHFRIQARTALAGFTSPKSEFAFQFVPDKNWSLSGGVLFEDRDLWVLDFDDIRFRSLSFFQYSFSASGRLWDGDLYLRFFHSINLGAEEEERFVIGFHRAF